VGTGDANDGISGCHTAADCPAGATCGLPLTTCMQDANGVCTQGTTFEVGTQPNDCVGACAWSDATGLGTCTNAAGAPINCYPGGSDAVIHAKGSHVRQDDGTFVIDTANARCSGATKSGPLNRQVGLPGLTFQKRSFRVLPKFKEGP
jgi:hypothetical protein